MLRRTLLAAIALTPLVAHAQTDDETLAQVANYLNGMRALKARFLQIAPDGKSSSGTLWLERPGRMRFQYDPPSPLLLVAGGGTVIFHDSQLDQTTNIPVDQTPLGLLLADRISLAGDVKVTEFDRPPGQLLITLVRSKTPGDGSLTLILNANPLALVGWSVIDAQGRETRLRMSDVQPGGPYDPKLFTFVDPDEGK